ncbi:MULTISPECIES: TIGR04372 family glycosyltransferase [unclassified Bradyrhizobium]|uniref:TIGR04372 family glycosyltransferase n=1 Tax=unclassified Bradyrhizobium TaxID=2631580 RepID=UPI0028E7FC04|nr:MULTISPECIES: TIGR04372 family glycosyltransferase [unclassified Bradyrhizobium]
MVAVDASRVRGGRRLQNAYQGYVTSLLAKRPARRFSGRLMRQFPIAATRVLLRIGACREAYELVMQGQLGFRSTDLAGWTARELFEHGEFEKAHRLLSGVAGQVDLEREHHLAFLKGGLDLIAGDEAAAAASARKAGRGYSDYMRPHQNMAARPAQNYVPNPLDSACGSQGRLFDLCNYTGQRLTHVGRGELGSGLFERALVAQSQLRSNVVPILSAELAALLTRLGIPLDQLRILAEEWTSQIGHLGMLDILFRMRDLGWWSGRPVLVVRRNLVANKPFSRLFERFAEVVVIGESVSQTIGEELLSLQRWYGMSFNVFQLPSGDVVPWQEAGALAVVQWEKEGRGHPLRDEYDRIFGAWAGVQDSFQGMREAFGMKPDDWYVCLHTRDAAHYSEVEGSGQTHRNSPIESYLDAVHFITDRGGWVIKLGGPNSPKLPPMDRVIDYARSRFRSELMDICLIRHAKFFIGTTSGLTNVAISFGVPCALVNCITTDAQLWTGGVRFAPKPIRRDDGTMLTQAQLTSSPWRWRQFDAGVLRRSGAQPYNNTSDEISAVVEEVEALASGRPQARCRSTLVVRWRKQLAIPHYYGASTISSYYLKKYEDAFLRSDDDGEVSGNR